MTEDSSHQNKKQKLAFGASPTPMDISESHAIIPVGKVTDAGTSGTQANTVNQILPKPIERLALSMNPNYLQRLKSSNVLGYERPTSARFSGPRFYDIDIIQFKAAMQNVLKLYLTWKYNELGKLPSVKATTEIDKIVPICVDACMTALYAKLRTIHKQYGKYSTRFGTPPTYSKDLELPLPFADAIQNFGVFESRCLQENHLMIPVYPEGTKHEGRSSEDWNSYQYESCMPILKECGIPLKSVDTRSKFGTAWWTYRVKYVHATFDFQCILPQLHYTNHSAICASMFALTNKEETDSVPIVKLKPDDGNFGYVLREMPVGIQLRAFSALCHASSEEWNFAANVD